MHKTNKVATAKVFVPGSESDELSYAFVEPIKDHESGSRIIFGVFQIRSTSDLYHTVIAQTVRNFTDYFKRAPSSFGSSGNQMSTAEFIFENALQYTSAQLTQFLRDSGEQDRAAHFDPRRVSMLLGMIWDNELYISTAGSAIQAYYLYPSQKQTGVSHYGMVDILEGNEDAPDLDLSTLFSQVIAGSVAIPESTLIVCNDSFLDYVERDQIKQAVTSYPNEKLSSYFQNLLGKANTHVDFSSLFLKMTQQKVESYHHAAPLNPSRPQQQAAPHTSMEELISTEEDTEAILSPAVSTHIKDAFSEGIQAMVIQPLSKLKDLTKKIRIPTSTGSTLKKITPDKAQIAKGKDALTKHAGALHARLLERSKTLIHDSKITYYRLRKKEPAAIKDELLAMIKEGTQHTLHALRAKLETLPLVSKALLVVAVIFFVAFIASIFSIRGKQVQATHDKEYQAIVASIEQSANSAEASLIYDDEAKAKLLVVEAESKLASLPQTTDTQRADYTRLQAQIAIAKNKISKIITPSSTSVLAELDGQIPTLGSLKIATAKDGYMLYNDESVYSLGADGKVLQVNTQAKVTSVHCASQNESGVFYFCANQDKLFSFNTKDQSIELSPITLPSGGAISDLSFYNSRAYILDGTAGTLTRHTKSNTGFGGPTSVISDTSLLTGAKSLAIDGSILVIKGDGTLTRITSGKATPAPYPEVIPAFTSAESIWTNGDTQFAYLFDRTNMRIIVLDKRGDKLKAQIVDDRLRDIKDIAINEQKKEIALINGTQVITVPIDFLEVK